MRGKRSVLVGSVDVAWATQEGSVDANVLPFLQHCEAGTIVHFSLF